MLFGVFYNQYENFCIKNGFGCKTAQKSHFDQILIYFISFYDETKRISL